MKKIVSLFLAVAAAFCMTGCRNSGSGNSSGSSSQPSGTSNQLIVGSVSDLNADMMDGWTNAGQNKSIKALINGYETVSYTKEGMFIVNKTAVRNLETAENADGTKTFTVSIREGLTFNDGSAITASDYVFNILLYSSPEFGALEGDNFSGIDYVGFEGFHSGETRTFSGIRLLDEYTFSITVKAENFPYYYELNYAGVTPLPMAVIAPGVTLSDNGDGAFLSEEFNAELLQKTILDAETGYRYRPSVSSGPYRLESYDASTKQAVLTLNPHFQGNYDGQKPVIQKLILKSVTDATMIDELSAGSVGLLTQISGTTIDRGLDLAEEGKVDYAAYLRAGYGRIAFAANHGPTQFAAVRQAIAYCLDRDEFARQYSGGHAKVVDGYYGLSQREYRDNREALESELIHYTYNLEKARELLVADGWTKNASGGAFQEGTDPLRYKEVDGNLMPLIVRWANTANNPVSDLINTMLPSEMKKIGMELQPTTMELGKLLNELQQTEGQNYHMFNLGTGFGSISAVWYYYNPDLDTFGGGYNSNFIADEGLYRLAADMKATEPGDTASWDTKWLEFQKRWNELLPDIPLYSDDYHDFFTTRLKNYQPDGLWPWENAILYAELQ